VCCGKHLTIISEGKVASHNVTSLKDLSRQLRDKLIKEMKILCKQNSELNGISKDACRQLSKIKKNDVKKMLARVHATANATSWRTCSQRIGSKLELSFHHRY